MLLAETLKKAYQFFPQKQAIVCGGRRWTYGEFYGRLCRFAQFLKEAGIEKGDRVAILHPNCHCFLEVYYAVALIGAAAVPLNFRLSPGEITLILNDAGARLLIADPRFRETVEMIRADLPTVERIVWTGDERGEFPDGGRDCKFCISVCGSRFGGHKGRRVGMERESDFAAGAPGVRISLPQHPRRFFRMADGNRR